MPSPCLPWALEMIRKMVGQCLFVVNVNLGKMIVQMKLMKRKDILTREQPWQNCKGQQLWNSDKLRMLSIIRN